MYSHCAPRIHTVRHAQASVVDRMLLNWLHRKLFTEQPISVPQRAQRDRFDEDVICMSFLRLACRWKGTHRRRGLIQPNGQEISVGREKNASKQKCNAQALPHRPPASLSRPCIGLLNLGIKQSPAAPLESTSMGLHSRCALTPHSLCALALYSLCALALHSLCIQALHSLCYLPLPPSPPLRAVALLLMLASGACATASQQRAVAVLSILAILYLRDCVSRVTSGLFALKSPPSRALDILSVDHIRILA
jgi:hypothetical protein